ncbi:MAG: tripartite tricarboxylate transporter TctB family protein [Deltaproteobacteria bacterium]
MRPLFRDRDVTSSLFWALIGILFCIGGFHYGIRRSGIPGPGFLPFVTGIILAALSLTLLLSRLLNNRDRAEPKAEPMPAGQALQKILKVLGALCLYVLILEHLGFVLATFLFMVLLLRLEPRRWIFIIPGALGATAFFFVLFKILLRVPLPAGLLGY